ncbi:MAG: 16S rRNA (cytidine(1402)-2'-O)-methyltransferase [Litorimonas sp.]
MSHPSSISGSVHPQYLTGEFTDRIPPALYIVATPIGNLRDITLRALDVLSSADHILAEDTRVSAKLLNAYNIKAKLSAYHDHNVATRIPEALKELKAGKTLALISDAGTPLVSDPGFKLVRAAIEAGIEVIPLPGASAVLAGLVKSGLPSDRFLFAGFLPPKSAARKTALQEIINLRATLVFFETGKRIKSALTDIQTVLGSRQIVIARELTKHYEEARHGTIAQMMTSVEDDPPRGEIVLLIGPPETDRHWDEAQIMTALQDAVAEQGVKRASADIAQMSGWPKRDVYQLALKIK